MLGSANLGLSVYLVGFYCNFVNFNFIPLGYGEVSDSTEILPLLRKLLPSK